MPLWYPKLNSLYRAVTTCLRLIDVWYGSLACPWASEVSMCTHRADSPLIAIPGDLSPPGAARRDRWTQSTLDEAESEEV